MLTLEVNEKEQAPLGQRIRAVGIRGVVRIFQSGGHTVQKRGFSPGFMSLLPPVVGCFLNTWLTKGGHRHPKTPPLSLATPLVGMCFNKKGYLKKGDNYQLCRNSQRHELFRSLNPVYHDGNYELKMNFSCLLAPFVDENIV